MAAPGFEVILTHIVSVTSSMSAAFRSPDVGSANGSTCDQSPHEKDVNDAGE